MAHTTNVPIMFILLPLFLSILNYSQLEATTNSYVREACSVTAYQNLCIRSLASFSNAAKKSPSKWARAGVSVTISEAKNVTLYLKTLKKSKQMKGKKNQMALSDCVECLQDAVDELYKSLDVLRSLSVRRFDTQMGDLTTWLSTTLTDENTCLDGFEGQRGGKVVKLVRHKVLRSSYYTSNALALVNKLATTGL